MGLKRSIASIFLSCLLVACSGSLHPLRNKTPEYFAMSLLSKCMITKSDAGKMREIFTIENGMPFAEETTGSDIRKKYKAIKLSGEEVTNIWDIINPFNGVNYNIMITDNRRCMVSYENGNAEEMKKEFSKYADEISNLSNDIKNVKVENTNTHDSEEIRYKIPLNDMAAYTQLNLFIVNKENSSIKIMWTPAVY